MRPNFSKQSGVDLSFDHETNLGMIIDCQSLVYVHLASSMTYGINDFKTAQICNCPELLSE
jgi:hypothetical protein